MLTTATRTYPHLTAAAEAVTDGTLAVGDGFRTPAGRRPHRWEVQELDGAAGAEPVFVPHHGGRCYEVSYCLGEGREAILRTAAMRASS